MTPTLTHQPDLSSGKRHIPAAMAARTRTDLFREHGLVVNHVGHDDHDDGLVHAHEWAAAK